MENPQDIATIPERRHKIPRSRQAMASLTSFVLTSGVSSGLLLVFTDMDRRSVVETASLPLVAGSVSACIVALAYEKHNENVVRHNQDRLKRLYQAEES